MRNPSLVSEAALVTPDIFPREVMYDIDKIDVHGDPIPQGEALELARKITKIEEEPNEDTQQSQPSKSKNRNI